MPDVMFRRVLFLLLLALHPLVIERTAFACSCSGGLSFDETVKHSTIVLLGRVKAQGRVPSQAEVAYLDVEELEVFKGARMKPVARLWDSYAGTGCGGGLEKLPPGTLAVFSVEENKSPHSLPELWNTTGIRPGAEDYLFGTCSQFWKTFKTEHRARSYTRRLTR
jgi:hypothetical protein